ncbi:MAG TPA: class II fructose-bisphosphate aldolase [Vitreimonas sp.]|nr:class II fructose-bisphosphate aldolase [Vitreimonas sp.]
MSTIDHLIHKVHFGSDNESRSAAQEIRQLAEAQGARPASIHELYLARGRGEIPSIFTVPAMNLRGLSYLTAQAAFIAAEHTNTGLLIFELARSEMKYTAQPPHVFASSILAAAVKTGWQLPVFIQGDHVQPKAAAPGQIKEGEQAALENLIREEIAAGFYNIDLDGSTLVDSSQTSHYDQQRPNYTYTANMAKLVRSLQPSGVIISLGCEIAEVGTHLSSAEQFEGFMTGFTELFGITDGLAKVAIQTGTSHGGSVNPDGTPGPMKVDFETIRTLSRMARERYGMAGGVQHGASTLSDEMFAKFPQHEAAEIHLSTGFQNAIMDHPAFPAELKQQMYRWCDEHCADERKPEWTDAQFYIKTRKKAWQPFKEATWNLPEATLSAFQQSLIEECAHYYHQLNVINSQKTVSHYLR